MASGLRFAPAAVDPQLKSDLENLGKFSEAQLTSFADSVLRFVVDPSSNGSDALLLSDLQAFAQAHGVNSKALKNTVRSTLVFFQGCVKHSLSAQQVRDDLVKMGTAAAGAETVAQRWQANFQTISRAMAGRTLTVNQLVDIEWSFGVTASTSELAQVGQTFLKLKLVLDRGPGEAPENVFAEVSLEQFYDLLAKFEQTAAQMELIAEA